MEKVLFAVVGVVGVIGIVVVVSLIFSFPVMWCWNYVMPYLFGLKIITWGHAWCLSFLSGTLIKSTLNCKK